MQIINQYERYSSPKYFKSFYFLISGLNKKLPVRSFVIQRLVTSKSHRFGFSCFSWMKGVFLISLTVFSYWTRTAALCSQNSALMNRTMVSPLIPHKSLLVYKDPIGNIQLTRNYIFDKRSILSWSAFEDYF